MVVHEEIERHAPIEAGLVGVIATQEPQPHAQRSRLLGVLAVVLVLVFAVVLVFVLLRLPYHHELVVSAPPQTLAEPPEKIAAGPRVAIDTVFETILDLVVAAQDQERLASLL